MTMTGAQLSDQWESEFTELLDAVVSASAEAAICAEWGSGVHTALRELKEAKDALRALVLDKIAED